MAEHPKLTLTQALAAVDKALAAADGVKYDPQDYDGWKARRWAAEANIRLELELNGATFGGTADHSVKLAGIRATSTTGFEGALRNWRTAAARKLAEVGRASLPDDVINLQGSGPAAIEPREG